MEEPFRRSVRNFRFPKELLTEEYPLSEQYITEIENNRYVFESEVASLEGVGRFALGLLDEVTIHRPERLKAYLRKKIRKIDDI